MIEVPRASATMITTTPPTLDNAYDVSLGSLASGLRNFYDSVAHQIPLGAATMTTPTNTPTHMMRIPGPTEQQ